MNKFIQQNKKKLLAIFTALLMITFVASTGISPAGRDRTVVLGKVGDATITTGDTDTAYHDLRAFGQLFQFMGLDQVYQELSRSPVLYVLLQREAEAAGVTPSVEEIEGIVGLLRLRPEAENTDSDETLRQAARRFLLVRSNYLRIAGRQKATMTEVLARIQMQQQPTINLVEVKADEFTATVGTPSPQEIQAVYDKFASQLPASGMAASTQPATFGYLQPTRVKLQYLQIPKTRLAEVASKDLSTDDAYNLDRLAFSYYDANKPEFELKPEEIPLTPLGPTTAPVASQPTTKSFEAVKADIRRRLLLREIEPAPKSSSAVVAKLPALRNQFDSKLAALRQKVADRLTADFQAYAKGEPVLLSAGPTATPSTQPTAKATPAPPFESPAYLDAVLNSVLGLPVSQSPATLMALPRYDLPFLTIDPSSVLLPPTVKLLNDRWYTGETINQAEGISIALAGSETFAGLAVKLASPTPFIPTTGPATGPSTAPTTSPATRPAAKSAWALYQPSPLLSSPSTGDGYVFRLTAFEGERIPSLDEVRNQIVEHLKLNKAYMEAHKTAQNYLESASRKANLPTGGLPDIASLLGRKLIVAGPISPRMPIIPGYPTSDPASIENIKGGVGVLARKATPATPHPSVVIDLPSAGKALVAELRSVERPWMQSMDYIQQRESLQQTQQMNDPGLMQAWFASDAIVKRTGYAGPVKGS